MWTHNLLLTEVIKFILNLYTQNVTVQNNLRCSQHIRATFGLTSAKQFGKVCENPLVYALMQFFTPKGIFQCTKEVLV